MSWRLKQGYSKNGMTGRSIALQISLMLFVKLWVNTLNYGVPLHDRSFSCSPFLYLAWMLYVFCRLSASRFCFSSLMVVFYNSQVQYIMLCKNLEQFFLFPFVRNNIFPSTNYIQAFFKYYRNEIILSNLFINIPEKIFFPHTSQCFIRSRHLLPFSHSSLEVSCALYAIFSHDCKGI